jgi:hypothetical protein
MSEHSQSSPAQVAEDERHYQRLRIELLIERNIKEQLDELVKLANNAAAMLKGSAMEESQLRNLLDVSLESGSIEVIINFIRYQIGRKSNAWSTERNGFGHHIIDDIRIQIKEMAEKVVLIADFASFGDQAEVERVKYQQSAYLRLTQLYLGYLGRAFSFAKKTNGFDTLKEIANVK